MSADLRHLTRPAANKWTSLLSLQQFEPGDTHAPHYRARMVQSFLAFTPFVLLGYLLNVAVLTGVFADELDSSLSLPWLATLLLQCSHNLLTWHRNRRKPIRRVSARAIKWLTVFSAFQGLTWGLVPLVLFAQANPLEQVILCVICTVMVSAGAFFLSSVPASAIAYVSTLGFSLAIAVLASGAAPALPLGLMLSAYTILMLIGTRSLGNDVVARLMNETQTENQRHLISLLLRDFEEHASDILWEIDQNGMLRHASSRLLTVLEVSQTSSGMLAFQDLLARKLSPDREASTDLEKIKQALAGKTAFRDMSLKLSLNGETRWWMITAKPLTDGAGELIGWRGILADVTEARVTHERLVRLAHYCSLTGLANRHYFVTRLAEDLGNLRDNRHLAVLYVDLDNFKRVNDSYGHGCGDKLLKNISSRLQESVRENDLVARLGGDEFAILLHDVNDRDQALSYAHRLLEHVEPAYKVDNTILPTGLSIGVALAPWHGEHADELMRAADLAMYSAKSGGKGRVAFYDQEMGAMSRRKRTLEDGLRGAIERGELRVVYQPQISMETGKIVAFEALARWNHAMLGEISPAEFIPIAEETGQIEVIGNWVLHEACKEAAHWAEDIGIAVNVSPVQAMAGTVLPAVRHALEESGLNVNRLELEITESIFLNDNPSTLEGLHALRDLGAKIALDDFGVGYSSLAYLRRFPFSSLKIDRAFTREIETSEQSRAIIRAIVALARSMGMTIIAEGVEQAEQVSILNELDADWAQGFWYSRPIEPAQARELLNNWSAPGTEDSAHPAQSRPSGSPASAPVN